MTQTAAGTHTLHLKHEVAARWAMKALDGESYVATGTFTEIEAPEKLVQTWQ